ncbi:T9SS type A sorting domain-containing protein [Chryseobacterium sp. SIMBA_038]
MSHLNKGIYYIKLKTTKASVSEKFIKK